jgi:hypothetical protein
MAHTEASKTGWAYLLVLPGPDPETPRITVEHPAQCITYSDPADRRARLAGFKRWAVRRRPPRDPLHPEAFYSLPRSSSGSAQWASAGQVANPIGVVPMVPMLNLPNMLGGGMSDLQRCWRSRTPSTSCWPTCSSTPSLSPTRSATPPAWRFRPTPRRAGRWTARPSCPRVSRLWVAEDPNVKFGELEGSDGLGYVRQIEALVQHIAAQTRTPPHYLLGQSGAFPSGESLKATETGLVAKVA